MITEKKKKLKGFTLAELIVVIAVFGILLAASMSLIAPLNHVFKNTAQHSNSSAIVDNVRRVLEDNLRYANRMYIYYGDSAESAANPDAFMDTKVQEMRTAFRLGSAERVTYSEDRIYAMRIHNPRAGGFANIPASAEMPGKISIYEYEFSGAANVRTANSKEWAVSQALYGEYAFALSFGIKDDSWVTTEKTVAGVTSQLISSVEYNPVNFVSPADFTFNLDIFEKDYANRADKRNSAYTLCRTYVSNPVTLSLQNVTEGATLLKEPMVVNDGTGEKALTEAEQPVRFRFENQNLTSGSDSADIIIIYTVPDIS